MTWRNLFFTGLVLGLSPFFLPIGGYFFIYSLLGFGLCAVSYIFKRPLGGWDYAILAELAATMAAGLINFYPVFVFFEYLFFAFLFASFAISGKSQAARFISLPMLAVSGASIALYLGSLSGFNGLYDAVIFLYYFIYFMAGAAFLFASGEPEKNGSGSE